MSGEVLFKKGELVAFYDEDGNLRRGRVKRDHDPDNDVVNIVHEPITYGLHVDTLKSVSVVDQLAEVAENADTRLEDAVARMEISIERMLGNGWHSGLEPREVEAALMAAMSFWEIVRDPKPNSRVHDTWQKAIREAYDRDARQVGSGSSFAQLAGSGRWAEPRVVVDRVIVSMRVVWDRLRDPIEQLGALAG